MCCAIWRVRYNFCEERVRMRSRCFFPTAVRNGQNLVNRITVGAVLLAAVAGCASTGSLSGDAASFKNSEYAYEGANYRILHRKSDGASTYETMISRDSPVLNKSFNDGLQAKTALRHYFNSSGICAQGTKAYAVPGQINFKGNGIWQIRINCA